MSQSSITPRASDDSGVMQYRRLGRTELNLSVIGFGASPLGDVYGTIDPGEARRAVQTAIDEGINYFDVSPYYGLTLAEERLGAALKGRRSEVILSTKCGRYGADHFDFSAARVTRSVDESLRRLGTDHVDLLLAHDVEFGDLQQVIEETLPAMERLQKQGKARHLGVSGYPLRALMRVAEKTDLDVILSYCHYSLLADDLDDVLVPFAQQRGIGLINASPLHMGLLSEQGAPAWHPAPEQVRKAARQAAEFCRSHGVDLADLALRYCFRYPLVATTLVGMATREQVYKSLRTLAFQADEQMMRQVRTILSPVFNHPWTSGRAENQ